MEPYATLRGVAPLILLRYLYLGGENESVDETMAALGVTNRNYFYRARGELYRRGLLTRDGKLPGLESVPPQPVVNAAIESVAANPLDLNAQLFPESGDGPIILEIEPEAAQDVGWHYDQSPISVAAAVDRMDDSGDIRKASSPAQARRKAQIKFLQAQYERLFDGKALSESRAKEMLILGDESAEIVLGALEQVPSHIEYPFGYAKKILERERQQTPANRGAMAATNLELATEEDNYWLNKPTDRIAQLTAKLRAKGMLAPTEVDDD